jgi:hypothetical protein
LKFASASIRVRLSLNYALSCISRNLMEAVGTRLNPYEIVSPLRGDGRGLSGQGYPTG